MSNQGENGSRQLATPMYTIPMGGDIGDSSHGSLRAMPPTPEPSNPPVSTIPMGGGAGTSPSLAKPRTIDRDGHRYERVGQSSDGTLRYRCQMYNIKKIKCRAQIFVHVDLTTDSINEHVDKPRSDRPDTDLRELLQQPEQAAVELPTSSMAAMSIGGGGMGAASREQGTVKKVKQRNEEELWTTPASSASTKEATSTVAGVKVTAEDVQRFRHATWLRLQGDLRDYEAKALYRVVGVTKDAAELRAVHIDLFANGRDDLQKATFVRKTTARRGDGTPILMQDLIVGDVVVVTKLGLQSTGKWQVLQGQVVDRLMKNGKLAMVANRISTSRVILAIEGSRNTIEVDPTNKKFWAAVSDDVFTVDIAIPQEVSRCYVSPSKNAEDQQRMKQRMDQTAFSKAAPQVVSLSVSDFYTRAYKNNEYPTNVKELIGTLIRRFALAAPTLEALEEDDRDCVATAKLVRVGDDGRHLTVKLVDSSETQKLWKRRSHVEIKDTAGNKQLSFRGMVDRVVKSAGSRSIYMKVGQERRQILERSLQAQPNRQFEVNQPQMPLKAVTKAFLYESFEGLTNRIRGLHENESFCRLIEALYGGRPMEMTPDYANEHVDQKVIVDNVEIELNPEQMEAIRAALGQSDECPAMVITAAFGTGRTLVEALINHYLSDNDYQSHQEGIHVVVSQTNNAVAKAVDAAEGVVCLPIMRVISKDNYETQDRVTKFDIPELICTFFRDQEKLAGLDANVVNDIRMAIADLAYGEPVRSSREHKRRYRVAVDHLIERYHPRRIFATVETLLGTFTTLDISHDVRSIIIDEAGLLGEDAFFALIQRFPSARVILVGDEKQLPPFAPSNTSHLQKNLARGDVFTRIVRNRLLPVFPLHGVYRTHPIITEKLSRIFYDNLLKSMVTEEERKSAMRRAELDLPFVFINVNGRHKNVGSSLKNEKEQMVAEKVVQRLIEKCQFEPTEIAVLCLYKEQMEDVSSKFYSSPILRSVFVDTVDAAQGKEWTVTVILTTRTEGDFDFLSDAKRTNVALSRGNEMCFILGYEPYLREADLWEKVICYKDVTKKFETKELFGI